jgi:hypothetical protein
MMGWEGPLMVKHAGIICANGGDILNVGFGLGLIDEEIQVCAALAAELALEGGCLLAAR